MLGTTWLYYFDEMVVGTASVAAGVWGGAGHIALEYCEVLLDAVNATCLRQSGFEGNGTVDRHIVDASKTGAEALHTAFSWRGFRYVKVRTSGAGLTFNGAREDIYARCVVVQLGAATLWIDSSNLLNTLLYSPQVVVRGPGGDGSDLV